MYNIIPRIPAWNLFDVNSFGFRICQCDSDLDSFLRKRDRARMATIIFTLVVRIFDVFSVSAIYAIIPARIENLIYNFVAASLARKQVRVALAQAFIYIYIYVYAKKEE